MISVFTPSFADEANTNAQNLTVKEVVARLDPGRFRITMFAQEAVDPRIANRPNTKILRYRKHANSACTLAWFLRDLPDIYFFPREGPLDTAILLTRKLARLRTAVVSYVVSGGLDNGNFRRGIARNVASSDVVVANSSFLSRVVSRFTRSEVPTIFDGVDRRFFYPAARPSRQTPAVLYAGSFRPWKRVPLVVQLAACWPQVQFRLAGTGEEESKCRDLVRQLALCNVEFLGHLSQPDLGGQMRDADIFFFPSQLEGHPQVLAQAAACGLPCVAMNSYQPEFVRHGQTGFLSQSDAELKMHLGLLLQHAELRRSMSCAALEHMRRFDWDQVSGQWAQVFELAVEKRLGRTHKQFSPEEREVLNVANM